MQPALGGDPQQRAGDLPPTLLTINPLRHPLTVSPYSALTRASFIECVNDTIVS
jgi:hypothetical protein